MGTVLYNIFIMPLEMFIETVFAAAHHMFKSPGISIIFVSIAVQLLCFPLYKRADDIQEQERQKQKEMERWTTHIKKTFKGDEKFMMLQTYYREVGYKPIYAIKGSISLLLQIPFFIAAYNFLSNLYLLNHTRFFIISDLGSPDQLLHIGGITLNVLPILMTVFNIISGIIYTKGFPIKDKVQTYGLACLFLVILYNSPSGLVFYWTLNNLFSLLKNVFMKVVKHPKEILSIISALAGIAFAIYISSSTKATLIARLGPALFYSCVFIISFALMIPAIYIFTKKKKPELFNRKQRSVDVKPVNAVFYTSITVLFILLGLLIPVHVCQTNPAEFISKDYGPFGLIFKVCTIYIGFIFVWLNIFYVFCSPKIRKYFAIVTSVFAVAGVADYFLFGKNLGNMSAFFVFDNDPSFPMKEILINGALVAVLAAAVILIMNKKSGILKQVYQIISLTLAVLVAVSGVKIEKSLAAQGHPEKNRDNTLTQNTEPIIHLSKNGKNVIVFMLDRAVSGYIPYFFEEKPEMKEMFDGFTYYPNTLSFGGTTNYGAPSLFGGYEYTPTEMNARPDESLEKKNNEAITVLPKLFLDNGFNVSVFDPPYAGYSWIPDLSIYDVYPEIVKETTKGKYLSQAQANFFGYFEKTQQRNFVFYNLMKTMPLASQILIYQTGEYWSADYGGTSMATFLDSYSVLEQLGTLTDVKDNAENNFIMMQNDTTHAQTLLTELPDNLKIDSVEYPQYTSATVDGVTMDLSVKSQLSHYQTNMCALLRVGEWLNHLRELGVYDNTRIILVADHGIDLGQFDYMKMSDEIDVQRYNPLLLVKDFNDKGFKTSDEFMTTADTPVFAVSDVIKNPVNPFTGKEINSDEKTAHAQIITSSEKANIEENHGNVFDTSDGEWWSVEDNIFEKKNWKKAEVVQ